MRKLLICAALVFCTFAQIAVAKKDTTNIELTQASASILIETSSGKILYESNIREHLPIASVTKTMTMLLIMEAVDNGKITLEDKVVTSEYASSMGGSQIYLEVGEQMTVHEMLKAIAVASANDATVAMAEYISGSEDTFVELMNKRVIELGGRDTYFTNCNGLDRDNNYSCAYDVALISRELLKHQKIYDYLTIWTDALRDGKFTLANTNKLIRFYDGANGIKTGSTDLAKYCLSASAKRGDMQLITVVLGAPSTTERFAGASRLLDYGFANYSVITPKDVQCELADITVTGGCKPKLKVEIDDNFGFVVNRGEQNKIEKTINLPNSVAAPIKKGEKIGELSLTSGEEIVGKIDILASFDIPKITLSKIFVKMLIGWCKV